MKKLSTLCVTLFFGLSIGECGQMIADATFGDKYLKPISKSRQISASSQKEAVNIAVKAAGKTGWTPKTISVETGYVLAEYVADIKYTIVARDYTFRLEVRLPDHGKGDANIVITPPPGLVSSKTMDKIANVFLDALTNELATTTNVTVSEKAEKKSSKEIVQQPSQPLQEKAEVKPSVENPTQLSPSPPTSTAGVKETASQNTLIMTAAANVRSGPGVKSKIISKLKKGEKVVRLGVSGTRINVKLSSGLTGWVSNKQTKEYK
ncbi:MAG: SH3 domain-containing protein [Syntrophales bacterium]|nr:SH3 domain-containing protein [Syntrophales bacterium]